MKTKQFEVPTEIMGEFASLIVDHNLNNEITGLNAEGEIIVDVDYEPKQKAGVLALTELIEDFHENNQEE